MRVSSEDVRYLHKAVDVVKVDGKWKLMIQLVVSWNGDMNSLKVRYFAHNFSAKNSPAKGVKNGINSLELKWPDKKLKAITLKELKAKGVPGDQWGFEDLLEE